MANTQGSKKIAIYPGSFDPIHEGHINIIKRLSILFDKLYVVVSYNVDKNKQTDIDSRLYQVRKTIKELNLKNVQVVKNTGLTIEFAKKLKCNFIVRGIRNVHDYKYELNMAKIHKALDASIDTILFITSKELSKKSSTNIRDIQIKLKKLNSKNKE
ncbi:MAG: pantetheine-phosphate adenylyltransferase [Mycoplasma sp.]|nr:pantetheine-phosphate adenylyltransferase [Mycoplasma sp.]